MAVNLAPDYDAQTAAIQQRQKMAELLQQQAVAPFDIQSYKGVQAPIPVAAVLAKMLQSYQAAKMNRDATTDASALRTAQSTDAAKKIAEALGISQTPAAPPPAPAGPSPSDIASMPPVRAQMPPMPQANPIASALAQQPPAQMPQGDISDIAGRMQAPMGPPAQMPQGDISDIAGRMGAPFAPQQSTNPLAQALSNSGQPPGPASALPMQAQAPPMLGAPSPGMGGPMPPVMKPQVDLPPPSAQAPQSPLDRANAAYLSAVQMSYSSNPDLRAIAPILAAKAQEQIKKISDLTDVQTQKDAARAEDIQSATGLVKGLPGITDDQRAYLSSVASYGGMAALKSSLDKLSEVKFAPQVQTATPDQLKGYPAGTIGQVDATGKLINVYNPSEDQNRTAQLKIAQARLGVEQHNSAREDKVAAFNQDQKTNSVLDAATIDQMAQQAWAGDKSIFSNLGRGAQGAQNVVALRKAIYDMGVKTGKSGADLAAMNAQFVGSQREQSAIGQRVGAAEVSLNELPKVTALSQDAYTNLPRGQFMPFNKLKRAVDTQTSSPAQAAAYAADYAVISAYARALSPTGQPHEADKKRAEDMLSTAQSQEAHQAVLDQINREVTAITAGAKGARGQGSSAPTAAPPAASQTKVLNGVTYHQINGQWVQ